MEEDPVEADLSDLMDGVKRIPDALELKRRAVEGLHEAIQSRLSRGARPSKPRIDGPHPD
jgi:hypothetical protein